MELTIREYLGTELRDERVLTLPAPTPLTLGRSESCTYTIGKSLGKLGGGISRIHATIRLADDVYLLEDGSADGPSENGIYCHTEQIVGAIALVPGLELTLFKHGIAKVSLVVSSDVAVERHNDTYTHENLLEVLQEQVQAGEIQLAAIQKQVALLDEQLTQRKTIDQHQADLLTQQSNLLTQQAKDVTDLQRRVKRLFSGLLAFAAVIILGFGLAKDFSADERKEWRSLVVGILKELMLAGALGGGAFYLQQTKQSPQNPKP